MKKVNVKTFWNKHKNTIKKAVILVTVPVVVIGAYVVVNKMLDKHNKEVFEELENSLN